MTFVYFQCIFKRRNGEAVREKERERERERERGHLRITYVTTIIAGPNVSLI